MSEITNSISNRIDELEAVMLRDYEPVSCPVIHRFVPNMYIREIFMPAGTLITSLKHNTFHPFILSAGVVHVKINDGEWERLEAPVTDITKAGTKRTLFIEEDAVWTTCHATDVQPESGSEEDILYAVAKVKDEIIEPHINAYLGGEIINNILSKQIENQ